MWTTVSAGLLAAVILSSAGMGSGGALPYAAGAHCAADRGEHVMHCLLPILEQTASEGRERAGMDLLVRLMEEGALDDCHMLAHQLGSLSVLATGSVAASFARGDGRCAAGFYHGAAATFEELHGPSDAACAPIAEARLHRECVHGLGHGVFAVDGDRNRALTTCQNVFRDTSEAAECVDGALMENAMRLVGRNATEFAAGFVTACSGLDATYPEGTACYQNLGEAATFRDQHQASLALGDCTLITDENGRHQCVHGVDDEAALVAWERTHGGWDA